MIVLRVINFINAKQNLRRRNLTMEKVTKDMNIMEAVEKYPIISIEDGLDQDDWEGWKYLTEKK